MCCHRNTFSAATQRANTDVSFSNSPALMLAPFSGHIQQHWTDIESKLVVTGEHRCRLRKLTNIGVVFVSFQTSLTETDFQKQLCVHLINQPALLLFSSCIWWWGWGALPTHVLPSMFSVFASSLFFSVWFFHPGIQVTSFPQLAARIIPAPSVHHENGCQISVVTTGLHTIRHYCAFMKLNIYQSTRFNIWLLGESWRPSLPSRQPGSTDLFTSWNLVSLLALAYI